MKIYFHCYDAKGQSDLYTSYDRIVAGIKKYKFTLLQDKGKSLVPLEKADIFVIEVSQASTRAGYAIAFAIATRKPILCLYHESVDLKEVEYLSESASAKLIQLSPYNAKNIDKILSSYLRKKAKKEIVTTKFTLRIPPSVVEYLDWRKSYSRKSKAALLRDGFIEEVMEKDTKYQEYLKKKYSP